MKLRNTKWGIIPAVLVAAAVGAHSAGAMPSGGYNEPDPELGEPVVAPKPPTPSCYAEPGSTNPCGYNVLTLSVGTVTSRSVEVKWTTVNGPEKSYVLERRTPGGTFSPTADIPGTATSYTDDGLSPETSYEYRLRGSDPNTVSEPVSARTLGVISLTASGATTRSVNLQWNGVTGATGYTLDRKLSSSTGGFEQVKTLAPDARSTTDTGLAYNTGYDYRIRASGVNVVSNVESVRTRPAEVDRVSLSPESFDKWTHYSTRLPFIPDYAEILKVKYVSRTRWITSVEDPRGADYPVRVEQVTHQSVKQGITDTRSVPKLDYGEETHAFDGQRLKDGQWDLYLSTGAYKPDFWDCGGPCNHHGKITLEVTWA